MTRREMQAWKPFGDLWDLQDEVNRLFYGFGRRGRGEGEAATWAPLVDIYEDKESVKITAELPGMTQKDVKITVHDGTLTLKGERKFEQEDRKENYYRIERSYGTFARSFTLPTTVDAEKIHANMKDGVLEVLLPKKEEAKPKEIEVTVS